jgi:penicillin amidase
MRRWGAPPENLIYADTDGAIGWKPGGRAPIRPNWDGLLPVPGDGRYEWSGYLDPADLPVDKDPPRGFIATANQFNLPTGYAKQLGYEWSSPTRFERIGQVLSAKPKVTIEDMVRLQADYLSLPARRLVKLLAGLDSQDARLSQALELLRGWDGVLDASSPAAALFEIWYRRHLGQRWVEQIVTDPIERHALGGGEPELRIALLETPDSRLGPKPVETRNRILLESLAAAAVETEGLLGGNWSAWRWGSLHRAHLRHPISPLLDSSDVQHPYDVGPVGRGGSVDTVCKTMWRGADFLQQSGASFRVVIDVGAWDRSVAMNTPGQSGNPGDPHYRDLLKPWAAGEAFPLVYGNDAVAAAAEQRIVIEPAPR